MTCSTLRDTLEPALFDLFDRVDGLHSGEPGESLLAYRESVLILQHLSKSQRMHGLNYLCMLMDSGLQTLHRADRALLDSEVAALSAWPGLLLNELFTPDETEPHWQALHELRAFDWFPALPRQYEELIVLRLSQDRLRLRQDGEPHSLQSAPLVATLPAEEISEEGGDTQPMLADLLEEHALPPHTLQDLSETEVETDSEVKTGMASDEDLAPAANQVTAEELSMISDALTALAPHGDVDAEGLQAHVEQLDNIVNAVRLLGMTGLRQVLEAVLVNTLALQADVGSGSTLSPAQQAVMRMWPQQAMAYLHAPQDPACAQSLCQMVQDPAWLYPLDAEAVAPWPQELASVQIMRTRVATDRPTQALPEHVDLSVPSDIDRKVLDSLLQELPPHAQSFSELVLRLADGGSLADLEEARRVAHTLKGAANTVGIKGVANLTHALEDILVAQGNASALPGAALCDTLQEAADCLEAMSEALLAGQAGPVDALAVHQKVLDWANQLDRDGVPSGSDADVAEPHRADQAPVAQAQEVATPATSNKAEDLPAEEDDTESYLRVPASLIDALLKLAGENSILTSQIQDRVQRVSHNLHAMRGGARQFGQLSSELEQLVDVRGLAMVGGDAQDGLDALEMDQYNELHMLSRRILESSADSRELTRSFEQDLTVLRDLMAEKERMQLEIQRTIQRARMVDVASVVPRLQRTVRQAARLLGRQVQLHIQGAETLVDTQLLDRIIDPLMHLLRNAVDHGIEPADMRQMQGKDSTGHIQLTFRSVGNGIAVRCEDDGAGLDLAAIHRRGLNMGLLARDVEPDDAQVMRLILHPGFSTRTQTTQLSGRGIGMDVVYRTVLDLRGTLEMDTHAGQGTCFDLLFPVRMSTVQVMLTHSDRHMLALSVRGVEQILPAREELETDAQGVQHYFLQGERLPVTRLESLLGLPVDGLKQEEGLEVAMVIQDEHRQRHAILVPELKEARTVVVKPFNALMPHQLGVDGATILGDGAVASVLDLPDLLRAYVSEGAAVVAHEQADAHAKLPLCLVVDDSVSVRRTMEQLMQDSGYEVVTARDGVDALGAVQQRAPDIVLVDLEMPRMNGLELTCALRNRDATRATPVVMITSRFTDKHRQLADEAGVNAFLTKPYTEDLLLNTMGDLLRHAA